MLWRINNYQNHIRRYQNEREIEFRGKRVDNGEWVYGCLLTGFFFRGGQDITYIMTADGTAYDCFEDIQEGNGIYEVMPETVGQYTGFKDYNGKKIYEKDILSNKTEKSLYEIAWNARESRFSLVYRFKRTYQGESWVETNNDIPTNRISYCEIIGNTTDNLELLEVTE